MENIRVTLSDGKPVEVRRGTSVAELVSSLGLNGNIIAAKVDGRAGDLNRELEKDCSIAWVSPDSPDGLDILRHSTAHLMAQAVQSLFPGTQVTIGPTIEDGFFYDFAPPHPFAVEDLPKIEQKMRELAKADLKVERVEVPRDEAIKTFASMGERYKVEILADIPEER